MNNQYVVVKTLDGEILNLMSLLPSSIDNARALAINYNNTVEQSGTSWPIIYKVVRLELLE